MRRLNVVVLDAMAGTLLVVWMRLDIEGVAERLARDDEVVPGPQEEVGLSGCGRDDCEEPA